MNILVQSLTVTFGTKTVLHDLTLQMQAGAATALVGPSGVGKTTLLRTIAGLQRPAAGRVELGGNPPERLYGTAGLAFLFQEACLCPHLTIRQNLELIYWAHRRPVDQTQVDTQLEIVGLTGSSALYPHEASVGMKARVAIARMLCMPPRVLLMDEPFAALDPQRRAELNLVVREKCREFKTTSIWVSHDVVEALMYSDRIVALNQAGTSRTYDLKDLPPVEDAGALSEKTRALRDQIIHETMRESQ